MSPFNCRLNRMYAHIVAILIVVGSTFWQQEPVQAQRSPNESNQLYIPSIPASQAGEAENVANEAINGEWTSYTSSSGGYSFMHPTDWQVVEYTKGAIELIPPTGNLEDKVGFGYLQFEKAETEDLATWLERFYALELGPSIDREISPTTLNVEGSRATSQQAFVKNLPPASGESYAVSHAGLVLLIATPSGSELHSMLLRTIADSLEFTADAPTNLKELFGAEPVPEYSTIDHWNERQRDSLDALEALNIRAKTGEIPTEQLAAMSEQARKEFEELLVRHADLLEEIDHQRNLEAQLPDASSPTFDSSEYEESERRYNETLQDAANGVDSIASVASEVIPAEALQTKDFVNRRGMPARVTTPIRTYNRDAWCSSPMHYNKDTYAIDINVSYVPVYGTTQNEVVTYVETTNITTGWGIYIWSYSDLYVRGVFKRFFHVYAHLNQSLVSAGTIIQPETQIGVSGNTGNSTGPHLHFQLHTYANDNNTGPYVPVDLTPVKGFLPNLNYPITGTCGSIVDPYTADPIVIEANEYQYDLSGSGFSWTASTYYPNHTTQAYRTVTPITPEWGLAPINSNNAHLSPRLSYVVWIPVSGTWYVWVCGMGGVSR